MTAKLLDGKAIARQIREQPKTQSTPILAMTAKVSKIEEDDCLLNGCDDYIAKPFTYEQLLPRIENLLHQGGSQNGDGA